jgi:hypothetical protein
MNNVLPEGWRGSTDLNSSIQTYADLAYRVKAYFGYPTTGVEITDEQMALFIDKAIEWYTRYAGYNVEYLIFCDDLYERNKGVKLDDLFSVGYNTNNNYATEIITTEVTSTDVTFSVLSTESAYLSVAPFNYRDIFDINDPAAIKDTTDIGQKVVISFDPDNPWDSSLICDANCFRLLPLDFDYVTLSANEGLQDLEFVFEDLVIEYEDLQTLDLSTYGLDLTSTYNITEIPVEVLSNIGADYFPLSAFYPENENIGDPVNGCVNIKNGEGYLVPKCDLDLIDKCDPLSAQWGNGVDVSSATHAMISGFPVCMLDGNIALNTNNGIAATFTLCNSAIDTDGSMPVKNIQFLIDSKPPESLLYETICDISNGGLKIQKTFNTMDECIKHTPEAVPVKIEFIKKDVTEHLGTITTTISSNTDNDLLDRRKVVEIYEIEAGNRFGFGGGTGTGGLFNFDYMLMANVFGFDLQGNRSSFARNGYDLVTYHLAHSFIEQAGRMLRYISYNFNPDTQYLRIIPEPRPGPSATSTLNRRCYILGAYVEKPIRHVIRQKWVERYVIAQVMITLGLLRSKFGGVVLYGGSTINGDSLVTMGREDEKKLLDELRQDRFESQPARFFMM